MSRPLHWDSLPARLSSSSSTAMSSSTPDAVRSVTDLSKPFRYPRIQIAQLGRYVTDTQHCDIENDVAEVEAISSTIPAEQQFSIFGGPSPQLKPSTLETPSVVKMGTDDINSKSSEPAAKRRKLTPNIILRDLSADQFVRHDHSLYSDRGLS